MPTYNADYHVSGRLGQLIETEAATSGDADVILLIWPSISIVASYLLDSNITPFFIAWAPWRAYQIPQFCHAVGAAHAEAA